MPEESIKQELFQNLPVVEEFYSIQGEGYNSGKAAWFIRLAGCDVGCVWCDVKESWDKSLHKEFPVKEIVDKANNSGARYVIITGGEPLMYDLQQLTSELQDSGLKVFLETSGAYYLSGSWDWICLSPKKFKTALPENYAAAHELKVIVYNKSDLDWAEQQASMVDSACLLYLQPEWSKEKEMLPLIIDYVKCNPKWEVSLQTHKYMQVP